VTTAAGEKVSLLGRMMAMPLLLLKIEKRTFKQQTLKSGLAEASRISTPINTAIIRSNRLKLLASIRVINARSFTSQDPIIKTSFAEDILLPSDCRSLKPPPKLGPHMP
jgi:hypothetical protein